MVEVTTKGGARRGAGRPMGATGLKKMVAQICKEKGLNPTEEIVKIVLDQATPLDIRARLLQDLQSYVFPRLKAIEITGSLDDDRPIEIVSYAEVRREELESDI